MPLEMYLHAATSEEGLRIIFWMESLEEIRVYSEGGKYLGINRFCCGVYNLSTLRVSFIAKN